MAFLTLSVPGPFMGLECIKPVLKLFYTVKLILRPPAVGIVCFVVHDQLVVHEVEAVGLRLIGVQDHLAHFKTKDEGFSIQGNRFALLCVD